MRETESERDTQREKERNKMYHYYCETKLFKGERSAALRECHKSNEFRDTKTTALSVNRGGTNTVTRRFAIGDALLIAKSATEDTLYQSSVY
jgi:hypothetical protein